MEFNNSILGENLLNDHDVGIDTSSYYNQASRFEQAAEEHKQHGELESSIISYMQALGVYEQLEEYALIAHTLSKIGKLKNKRGDLENAIQTFRSSLSIYQNLPSKKTEMAHVLYEMANVYHDMGDMDHAKDYWEKVLPMFREAGLLLETAKTMRHIGFIYQDMGNQLSIDFFKQSIPLFEEIEAHIDIANLNYSIGLAYYAGGNIQVAIEYYENALKYYKLTSNPFDEAETLYSLCLAFMKIDDRQNALKYYIKSLLLYEHNPSLIHKVRNLRERGLEFFSQDELNKSLDQLIETYSFTDSTQDPLKQASNLHNIALIYKAKGDLENAYDFTAQSIELYKQLNLDQKQAPLLQNLGLISHAMKNLDQALKYYNAAADLLGKNNESIKLTYVNTGIGNIFLSRGKPNDAITYFEHGLDVNRKSTDFLGKATIFAGLGNAYRAKGELDKALEMYIQSLDLYERSSNPMDEATVLYYLGETYFIRQDYDIALDKFTRALNIYEQNTNPLDLAKVLTGIGNIHRAKNHLKKAIETYLHSLELYSNKEIEDKAHTLKNIAEAYILQKDYDKAIAALIKAIDILNNSPNPLNLAIPFNKLGKIYYATGEYQKAFIFCAQAAELFEKSPNPHDIFRPLEEIHDHEPKKAISLAISNPLGINWYLNKVNQRISHGEYLNSEYWYHLWLAVNNWWKDVWSYVYKGLLEKSIYESNWRINFLLNETQRNITSESTLNFLFGANDLITDSNRKSRNLRDTQDQLEPMWFVEIPPKLEHSDKFLKIRVNNLIKLAGDYISFPSSTQTKNPPLARIKIDIETQWLQKIKVDHIFYPNSELEHKSYQLNPEKTWLKNIVVMELGDKLKKVNQLELMYSIEVYYDANSVVPSVKTTSKRIIIPIIRKNNLQEVEKFKENHSNSLAIFIASWSILFSIMPFLSKYNFFFDSGYDFLSLIYMGSLGLVVAFIGILYLFRGKNKFHLNESIHRSKLLLDTNSEENFDPSQMSIDLQDIEFNYSVDLDDISKIS